MISAGEGKGPQISPISEITSFPEEILEAQGEELRSALERHAADPTVRVLIVRLKRARDLDYTTASALQAVHDRLAERGQALFLVGMTQPMMDALERTGVAAKFGEDHLFPTRPTWFAAMNAAITAARDVADKAGADVSEVDTYLRR